MKHLLAGIADDAIISIGRLATCTLEAEAATS